MKGSPPESLASVSVVAPTVPLPPSVLPTPPASVATESVPNTIRLAPGETVNVPAKADADVSFRKRLFETVTEPAPWMLPRTDPSSVSAWPASSITLPTSAFIATDAPRIVGTFQL